MYEEGIKLSNECLKKLSEAELKVKHLSKDVNGNFELFDESKEE